MDENYTVYMHKNKVNGKVYIGITGRKPEERWGLNGNKYYPHQGYDSHFYNAIKKYGWDNFEHIILFTGLSRKQAEQKEVNLIAEYNTTDERYGYNMTNGGSTAGFMTDQAKRKISKANMGHRTVFQYDRTTGQFLQSYPTLIDASLKSGVARSSIVAICHQRVKSSKGFIFRYQDYGYTYGQPLPEDQMELCKNTHFRPVKQYDLNGNFIREFPSIRDAQAFFGKKQGNTQIWHCANHLNPVALGYRWSYSNDDLMPIQTISNNKTRQVLRYNQSKDLIAHYGSVKEAAASINVKDWTLIQHLRDQNKLYKNSYWKYA